MSIFKTGHFWGFLGGPLAIGIWIGFQTKSLEVAGIVAILIAICYGGSELAGPADFRIGAAQNIREIEEENRQAHWDWYRRTPPGNP